MGSGQKLTPPYLHAVAFINGYCWHAPHDLSLHAAAVHKLTRGHNILKYQPSLGALVQANGIDLASYLHREHPMKRSSGNRLALCYAKNAVNGCYEVDCLQTES